MIFKKKKDVVVPVVKTTEELLKESTTKLTSDIAHLSAMKDSALSSFRTTAIKLETINERLNNNIKVIDEMISLVEAEKKNAKKQVADNEAVRKKILDIIGE